MAKMQFHKEIKVSTGSYTNQQGEEKKSYCKIGALFINPENGNMSAKLDVLPIPNADGEVWLSFFDKYDENKQTQPQQQFGAQPSYQPQQPQTPVYAQPQQQGYNANMAPPALNQPVAQPQFNPNVPQDDTVF